MRTEVTALWIPQAIHDVAQGEAGATVFHSPEALQTELERRGLNDAWSALTNRDYQVDGDSAEITQVRRISEAPDHLEEFQYMMATAAGHPPRHEGREFSQVKVGIIPDTLSLPTLSMPSLSSFPNALSSRTNGRATNWATAARTEPTVARSWESISYTIFVRRRRARWHPIPAGRRVRTFRQAASWQRSHVWTDGHHRPLVLIRLQFQARVLSPRMFLPTS